MAHLYGRVLAKALLGMMAVLCIARLALAASPMTPEQIAAVCIEDMSAFEGDMISGVGLEASSFVDAVSELPEGTPIGRVFKMGSESSSRMDKIAVSAAARVEKTWTKCLAKIQRMNGDGSLLVDIAVAHDQSIEAIRVSLQSRQGAVAGAVLDYIEAQ